MSQAKSETSSEQTTLDPAEAKKRLLDRGARELNYVSHQKLMAGLEEAVRAAVASRLDDLEGEIVDSIAIDTREHFLEVVRGSAKRVRGLAVSQFVREARAARDRILRQRSKARAELMRLHQEHERRSEHFQEEFDELVRHTNALGDAQDEAMSARIRGLFGGSEDDPDVAKLCEQVTAIALMGMREERQKAVDMKVAEHNRQVANLQRRIGKLNVSLEQTEEELARIAKMKNVDLGVASIYRTVQGLSGTENNAEQKKEMMKEIFAANLALKEEIGAKA